MSGNCGQKKSYSVGIVNWYVVIVVVDWFKFKSAFLVTFVIFFLTRASVELVEREHPPGGIEFRDG